MHAVERGVVIMNGLFKANVISHSLLPVERGVVIIYCIALNLACSFLHETKVVM